MSYSSDLLSIDLGYMQNLDPSDRIKATDAETESLEITLASDQDTILEADDFLTTEPKTNTTPTDELPRTFLDRRHDIVTAIVNRQEPAIMERWPDFDMQTFTELVDKASLGITDISATVSRLVPAMLNQRDMNGKRAILWALTWLTLNSLQQTHERWALTGYAPLLVDEDYSAILAEEIQRLENGDLSIGLMTEELAYDEDSIDISGYLAAYTPTNPCVEFPRKLFDNPLAAFDEDMNIIFHAILGHETYHDYQFRHWDRSASHASVEVAAEILTAKIYIMMTGAQDSSFADFRGNASQSVEQFEEAHALFRESEYYDSPLRMFYETTSHRLPKSYAYGVYVAAVRELRTGKPAKHLRSRYEGIYGAAWLYDHILASTKQLVDRINQVRQSIGDEAFQAELAHSRELYEIELAKIKPNKISSDQELGMYYNCHVCLFAITYYEEGPESAMQYFEKTFLPTFNKHIAPAFVALTTIEDYVPEDALADGEMDFDKVVTDFVNNADFSQAYIF